MRGMVVGEGGRSSGVLLYQHCWEGTCDGIASHPGESVQWHSQLLVLNETRFEHWPCKHSKLPNVHCLGDDFTFTSPIQYVAG